MFPADADRVDGVGLSGEPVLHPKFVTPEGAHVVGVTQLAADPQAEGVESNPGGDEAQLCRPIPKIASTSVDAILCHETAPATCPHCHPLTDIWKIPSIASLYFTN